MTRLIELLQRRESFDVERLEFFDDRMIWLDEERQLAVAGFRFAFGDFDFARFVDVVGYQLGQGGAERGKRVCPKGEVFYVPNREFIRLMIASRSDLLGTV